MADALNTCSGGLITSKLIPIKEYLDSKRHIIDAHNVDFFTENLWENCLSEGLRKDLENLSEFQLARLPCLFETPAPTLATSNECSTTFSTELKDFLYEARKVQLKSLTSIQDGKTVNVGTQKMPSYMMTPKKSHEVALMAHTVYEISQKVNASKVVDLGSGKGYLSQSLALDYELCVVGVDSCDSNTKNAEKRNTKLLKAWHGRLRRQRTQQQMHTCKLEKSSGELSNHASTHTSTCTACSGAGNMIMNEAEPWHSCSCTRTLGFSKMDRDEGTEHASCLHKNIGGCSDAPRNDGMITGSFDDVYVDGDSSKLGLRGSSTISPYSDEPCHRHLCTVTSECSCKCKLCFTHLINTTKMGSHSDADTCPPTDQLASYIPVTQYVDSSEFQSSEGNLLEKLFKVPSKDGIPDSDGLILVGLHTCGDLAPTAIRIFVSDHTVRALCLVGCCYHLLTQSSSGTYNTDCGFPMSEFLRRKQYTLSRNATMVAQQAAARIGMESKLPPRSLFYRAVLQYVKSGEDVSKLSKGFGHDVDMPLSKVILREKFGLDTSGKHVGRIGAKCKTFTEYIRKAFHKLGLSESMMPDEEILKFYERFKDKERQIQAFHQLRASIAPSIESLFLMDRLCYLREQGFSDSSVVCLFDPVKSPRCYAIIATKEGYSNDNGDAK